MNITIAIVLAYLLGSISFAVLVSKLFWLADPRTYGSKNPGATNVLRSGNKLAAVLTLIGDCAKGWFAVWLALQLDEQFALGEAGIALIALASATRRGVSKKFLSRSLWYPNRRHGAHISHKY